MCPTQVYGYSILRQGGWVIPDQQRAWELSKDRRHRTEGQPVKGAEHQSVLSWGPLGH